MHQLVLDSKDEVQLLSLHIDVEDSLNCTPVLLCNILCMHAVLHWLKSWFIKVIAFLTYFQDSEITMLISHWRHPLTNNSESLSF